jgi:uncharacterized protein (TIGR03435 family)
MRIFDVAPLVASLIAAAAGVAFAQSPPEPPRFEVASVRPVATPARPSGRIDGGPGTDDPERITFTGVPMNRLLLSAYGILAPNSGELSGPPWIASEWYDVAAKVPPGATQEQVNLMLQSLLVERFGLKAHHETREVSGYELTVGKGGSKLKPAADSTAIPVAQGGAASKPTYNRDGYPEVPPGLSATLFSTGENGNIHVTGSSQSISDLVRSVILTSLNDGKRIVDKTGLVGKFDFKMDLAEDGGFRRPRLPALTPDDPVGPDIFTALDKYLGLKLQKAQIATDVVVIDHLEKVPAAN